MRYTKIIFLDINMAGKPKFYLWNFFFLLLFIHNVRIVLSSLERKEKGIQAKNMRPKVYKKKRKRELGVIHVV